VPLARAAAAVGAPESRSRQGVSFDPRSVACPAPYLRTQPKADGLDRGLAALRQPLPPPYDASEKVGTHVSSLSLVRFQRNVRRVARKMMRTSTSRPTVSSPRPGQPFEAPVTAGTTIKLRCATGAAFLR
jgi:hypothetical protein